MGTDENISLECTEFTWYSYQIYRKKWYVYELISTTKKQISHTSRNWSRFTYFPYSIYHISCDIPILITQLITHTVSYIQPPMHNIITYLRKTTEFTKISRISRNVITFFTSSNITFTIENSRTWYDPGKYPRHMISPINITKTHLCITKFPIYILRPPCGQRCSGDGIFYHLYHGASLSNI